MRNNRMIPPKNNRLNPIINHRVINNYDIRLLSDPWDCQECKGISWISIQLDPDFSGCFYGTEGPDHITGSIDDDCIHGMGGDDTIIGLSGNDSLHGGGGNDAGSASWSWSPLLLLPIVFVLLLSSSGLSNCCNHKYRMILQNCGNEIPTAALLVVDSLF